MRRNAIKITLNIVLFSLSVIIFLIPSLINGFPLVYSDSGTYIVSGYAGIVPIDRPIIYGLFVRYISMSYTLWFVIIFQSIMLTSIIFFIYKYFIKTGKAFLKLFITCIILGSFTGISVYTCQIMPDILTSISIICLAILLFSDKLSWYFVLIIIIIFIFSILSHLSNLLTISIILLILIPVVLIFKNKYFKTISYRSIIIIVFITSLSWIALPTINYYYKAGFIISKTKNIFLLSSLMESDILIKYLDENCGNKNYSLCKYKEQLLKVKAEYKFLWEDESPLYDKECLAKGGGCYCWCEKDKEYGLIIHDILKNKKYLPEILKFELQKGIKQLFYFHVINLGPIMGEYPILVNIRNYLNRDYYQYTHATQSRKTLNYDKLSMLQLIILIMSSVLMVLILSILKLRKILSEKIKILFCIIFLGIIINAFICSTLAMVVERYQGRIIWLIPFLLMVIIFENDKELFKGLNLKS